MGHGLGRWPAAGRVRGRHRLSGGPRPVDSGAPRHAAGPVRGLHDRLHLRRRGNRRVGWSSSAVHGALAGAGRRPDLGARPGRRLHRRARRRRRVGEGRPAPHPPEAQGGAVPALPEARSPDTPSTAPSLENPPCPALAGAPVSVWVSCIFARYSGTSMSPHSNCCFRRPSRSSRRERSSSDAPREGSERRRRSSFRLAALASAGRMARRRREHDAAGVLRGDRLPAAVAADVVHPLVAPRRPRLAVEAAPAGSLENAREPIGPVRARRLVGLPQPRIGRLQAGGPGRRRRDRRC